MEGFRSDVLDGDLSFKQVWDLTRYMTLLLTEFKVELMNIALANKDMVKMVEITEDTDGGVLAENKDHKAKNDDVVEEEGKKA